MEGGYASFAVIHVFEPVIHSGQGLEDRFWLARIDPDTLPA